jgi:hypothetical protein
MGMEKAMVQVLDEDGCVVGWALQIAGAAAGASPIGTVGITAPELTTVTGTKAAAGDNELIAAPAAGNRLVIVGLTVQNESAVATTVILKSGATAKRRALLQNQGDGLGLAFPAGREWRLGTAQALVLNLSGANSHGYTVDYYTEAV